MRDGTTATLDALKDERRRPALPRAPLLRVVMDCEHDVPFQLDQKIFGMQGSWPTLASLFGDHDWPNRHWPALVFQWYGRLWPKPTLAKPSLTCVLCVVVVVVVQCGVGFTVSLDRPFPGPPFPWTALSLDRPFPGPPFPWTALSGTSVHI